MFEKLKLKWKVESNLQLILILCTFAVTGTLTAYISGEITAWVGFTDQTFWLWKLAPDVDTHFWISGHHTCGIFLFRTVPIFLEL
jgi:hypothetical protein